MKENIKLPPAAGTETEYFPFESVTVPFVEPFKTTFTPGKADPSSEDATLPETIRSCAHALSTIANAKNTSKNFFIDLGLGLTIRVQIRVNSLKGNLL